MVELNKMTDKELAMRMVDYIERLESLMDSVSGILENRASRTPDIVESIHNTYRELKEEIRADGHYVSLSRNKNYSNNLYSRFFAPSISEASAWGLTASTNSGINQKFYCAIEEAHYKLRKHHGLDEWKRIAGY